MIRHTEWFPVCYDQDFYSKSVHPGLSLEPKVSGLEFRVRRMLGNTFMGLFLGTCFCLEVYNRHRAPI